jgi:hypothetical protein
MDNASSHHDFKDQKAFLGTHEASLRWEDISKKVRVDQNLGEQKEQQLWRMLERYQDVFAWNK